MCKILHSYYLHSNTFQRFFVLHKMFITWKDILIFWLTDDAPKCTEGSNASFFFFSTVSWSTLSLNSTLFHFTSLSYYSVYFLFSLFMFHLSSIFMCSTCCSVLCCVLLQTMQLIHVKDGIKWLCPTISPCKEGLWRHIWAVINI